MKVEPVTNGLSREIGRADGTLTPKAPQSARGMRNRRAYSELYPSGTAHSSALSCDGKA